MRAFALRAPRRPCRRSTPPRTCVLLCLSLLALWQVVTNQNNMPSGGAAILVVPEVTAQGETSVLVTACDDKALKLWLMPTFDKRGILASRMGHSDVARCLARGPGNSFFSGAMDNSIIVWEFMAS